MDTVRTLLEDAEQALLERDTNTALRKVRVTIARLDASIVTRASTVMYNRMDEWATFRDGSIDVPKLVTILADEGILSYG